MTETGTETGPLPPKGPLWAVDPSRATASRQWEGEMVVYDDVSGDTLKLDSIMTVIVHALMERPSHSADLVARLAEVLEVENDPKLRQLTEIGLSRLAASGLVRGTPEAISAAAAR
jgi:PqqD family protein of HPr-rel-A system